MGEAEACGTKNNIGIDERKKDNNSKVLQIRFISPEEMLKEKGRNVDKFKLILTRKELIALYLHI